MDSGGGGSQKQTVNQAPWKGQIPYLDTLFKQAEGLRKTGGPQYYPGETVAQFTPGQTQALDQTIDRGLNGSPLNKASSGYLQDVLAGQYLNEESPGFQSVANRAREAADATYAGAGRYGSGYHDRAVADSVGNLAFQNYNAERDRMGQAAGLAPTVAGQDFVDLDAALRAGGQYQNQQQNLINADREKFQYQQELPYETLRRFQDFIGQNYGGGSSQTIGPSNQPSTLQQLLGGGLALAGTAGGLGWAPFG